MSKPQVANKKAPFHKTDRLVKQFSHFKHYHK